MGETGRGQVAWLAAAMLSGALGAHAADFRVAFEDDPGAQVTFVGVRSFHMPHIARYTERAPVGRHYPIPRAKIARETYYQWLVDSGHFDYAKGKGPTQHHRTGVRHFMPLLAKYVQTKDRKTGEAIVTMLRYFEKWLRGEVKRKGWHWLSLAEPMYLVMYRQHLIAGGLLDPKKDTWFRDMFLFFVRTQHVWGNEFSFYRGPMHRAQAEGMTKALAAKLYPDAPEASMWRKYAKLVYQDFWTYKDIPPNDTGYFYTALWPMMVGAWLLGDDTFFTDPGMQDIWDRVLYEVGPDGIAIPYGAHGGWNASAGVRVAMLEMLAAKTRDGRCRYAAHKLMNYLLYQQSEYFKHHWLAGPDSTEKLAVAWLLTDESIKPIQPSRGSCVLYKKEAIGIKSREAAQRRGFLCDVGRVPDKGHLSSPLILTKRRLTHKLVLRSGWRPGDLFALVDLYPRHAPINAGSILGVTRHGAGLGMAINAKFSGTDNRLMIEDRGGTAPMRGNTDPDMRIYRLTSEVAVPFLEDAKRATFATITVSNYDGFAVSYTREIAFIKNRFLVTREIALFEEGFLARVGAVYNSQNVGPQMGAHWANTYFDELRAASFPQPLKNPAYDLLVYFAPQPGRRLQVVDRSATDPRAADVPAQLRYLWQGITRAGQKLCFTQVLYPHTASLKRARSNAPGAVRAQDLVGTAGADAVDVLVDTAETTVLRFAFDKDRVEWVVCNPAGKPIKIKQLSTDAQFAYVDVRKGKVAGASAAEATFLSLDGKDLFRYGKRQAFER